MNRKESQQRLFAECKFLMMMGEPHVRRLAIETTARTTAPSSWVQGKNPHVRHRFVEQPEEELPVQDQ